ncbi:MAG TPA: hypothetical protein VGJ60_35895 [Chloroflexota bacterium]|jgi:hypothetical protein
MARDSGEQRSQSGQHRLQQDWQQLEQPMPRSRLQEVAAAASRRTQPG